MFHSKLVVERKLVSIRMNLNNLRGELHSRLLNIVSILIEVEIEPETRSRIKFKSSILCILAVALLQRYKMACFLQTGGE